jgi:creatinine amidohydrolase
MNAGKPAAYAGERRIVRLTSPRLAHAIKSCKAIILPLGSVEQTGGHCPLGTDLIVAEKASLEIATLADCLVAPPLPYADTLELDFWPGTVHAGPEALSLYLEAAARSYQRMGFTTLIFLACHSLNMKSVDLLCRRLHAEGANVCAIDWWKAAGTAASGETESAEPFGHGGEVITSVMMALVPELVELASATDEASLPGLARALAHQPGSPFVSYGDFRDYTKSGAWGQVKATATAEKGLRWFDKAVHACAAFILETKSAAI